MKSLFHLLDMHEFMGNGKNRNRERKRVSEPAKSHDVIPLRTLHYVHTRYSVLHFDTTFLCCDFWPAKYPFLYGDDLFHSTTNPWYSTQLGHTHNFLRQITTSINSHSHFRAIIRKSGQISLPYEPKIIRG